MEVLRKVKWVTRDLKFDNAKREFLIENGVGVIGWEKLSNKQQMKLNEYKIKWVCKERIIARSGIMKMPNLFSQMLDLLLSSLFFYSLFLYLFLMVTLFLLAYSLPCIDHIFLLLYPSPSASLLLSHCRSIYFCFSLTS